MSDPLLPPWAEAARGAFWTLTWINLALLLVPVVIVVADRVFATGFYDDLSSWIGLIAFTLLALWLICGTAWLGGAGVTRYRARP